MPMFSFLSNMLDLAKGKKRADWVVSTWLRDHADEYDAFVAGIDKIAEGDITTVIEMYRMMKTCMTPEAEIYYDALYRLFCGERDAFSILPKLKHANEIGECAINGKTLAINIGTGDVKLTDNPCEGCLVVNVSDINNLWNALPLYSKAYCKKQFELVKSGMPKYMLGGWFDIAIKVLRIHYVANLVFMPGMMENLYNKAVNEGDGMLFAMYYFVTHDHGLQRMAKLFSKVVTNEVPDIDGVTMFKSTVHHLVAHSIHNGWDSKESWKDVAEDSDNDETWKEIMHAIRDVKAKHGKPIKQLMMDDILKCKDNEKAKHLITQFLIEYDDLFGPAYLKRTLEKADCIYNVEYMVFHRAIEILVNQKLDSKKPMERYGLLKNHEDKSKKHVRIWNKVGEIEKKWVPLFEDTL